MQHHSPIINPWISEITGRLKRTRACVAWRVVLISVMSLLTQGLLASGAEDSPTRLESQVKAAFLVKFASFIEWPAIAEGVPTNSPFVIGIFGNEAFGKNLAESVRNRSVQGRPVEVRCSNKAEKLQDCQMVFVSGNETRSLDAILGQFAGRPVLTVTDEPGGALRGGMINFTKEDGKVRFEFNLATAERSGMRLSAKLLQAGKIIVSAREDERSRT